MGHPRVDVQDLRQHAKDLKESDNKQKKFVTRTKTVLELEGNLHVCVIQNTQCNYIFYLFLYIFTTNLSGNMSFSTLLVFHPFSTLSIVDMNCSNFASSRRVMVLIVISKLIVWLFITIDTPPTLPNMMRKFVIGMNKLEKLISATKFTRLVDF